MPVGRQLPATCRVHYRFRDAQDRLTVQSEAMHPLGQSMIARRENVARPLEFRVTGGDDRSMPWRPVEVLDPPTVRSLSLDIVPPSYTNWPRETRDAAAASPILSGSRGTVGRGQQAATLGRVAIGRRSQISARIAGDGRSFRVGRPSPHCPMVLCWTSPAATPSRWSIATAYRGQRKAGNSACRPTPRLAW